MARHVYSRVATGHDKHNSRDSNQILLKGKDRKYSLQVARWRRSLLSLTALFSPLGKVAGRAIYFTDVFSLFLFFYFFYGRLSSQRS